MKKFYAALATATLCASTCLGGVTLRNSESFTGFKTIENVKTNKAAKKAAALQTTAKPVAAFEKAAPTEAKPRIKAQNAIDINGEYTLALGDWYWSGAVGNYESAATITEADGMAVIDCDDLATIVPATFDAATSTLTFSTWHAGSVNLNGATYYLSVEPYIFDYTLEDVVPQSISYTFDTASNSFEFNFTSSNTGDPGLSWVLYEDENYTTLYNYYDLQDLYSLMKNASDTDEEWTSVGDCVMVDAWILPSYGIDPAEYPYTAELQRNVENPNIFRVYEPYKNSPLAANNQSTKKGQIVMDITDPDHVRVLTGYAAGFDDGDGDFYVYDLLGWQISGYGDSWNEADAADLYAWMEEHGQPFTTFKDNVVTVNKSVFDVNAECTNAYTWNNNPYVVSTITFPEGAVIEGGDVNGVSTVATDTNADAPVEYFNLQGIRVAAPQAGQLVIKRQGTSVEKLIVR